MLQALTLVRRHGWIIVLTLLVAVGGGVAFTKLMPAIYSVSAILRVQTAVEGAAGQFTSYNIFYADRLMRTYSRIAVSAPILQEVAERLGVMMLPDVDVRVVTDTELMELTVSCHDPILALQTANTLADVLVERGNDLYASGTVESEFLHEQLAQTEAELLDAQAKYSALIDDANTAPEQIDEAERTVSLKQGIYGNLLLQYQNALAAEALHTNAVSVVEHASLPTAPSQPNVMLNLVLTTVFGLVAGLALALTAESLDARIRLAQDFENLSGQPVLALLPRSAKRRPTLHHFGSEDHAPFRRLWFHLSTLKHARQTPYVLLVTSARRGDGKSVVAANLASAAAHCDQRVLLIDADLWHPTLHRLLDQPNVDGVLNILRGRGVVKNIVHHTTIPNLDLLTSGGPLLPGESLPNLGRLPTHILRAAQGYDFIIIDSPAQLEIADASMLARAAGNVLIVVAYGRTARPDLRALMRQLEQVGANPVGMVVNRVPRRRDSYYHNSYTVDTVSHRETVTEN